MVGTNRKIGKGVGMFQFTETSYECAFFCVPRNFSEKLRGHQTNQRAEIVVSYIFRVWYQ